MPEKRSWTKTLLTLLLGLLLLFAAGALLLPRVLDLDTYKDEILAELRQSLQRPVTYTSGKFTFLYGPAFTFSDVDIKEPDSSVTFVTIKQLTCQVALLPLLQKKVVIDGLHAERPVVRIERKEDGLFNISDLVTGREGTAASLSINHIRVKDGTVDLIDRKISAPGKIVKIAETDLYISSLARGGKSDLKLSGKFVAGASGSFAISGKTKIAKKEHPLLDSTMDLKITARHLDVGSFWPYYSSYVPFKKISGYLEADTSFNGRLREFSSTGKIAFSGLRFDYQPIFKVPLTPASLQFKYSMELTKADVLVKALELSLDGVNIKGSCAIRDFNSRDPRITAQAVTSNFDFKKCNQYIPYGIIVKDTSEWIEQHIKGGIYRLDDGRLDGRVSQIVHMEKGENYNVLYIKGRVEKGVISYGPAVPTFNNIKGILEMKGKDFNLHQMSGNFGTSPLTLEGKITDYPLDKPSSYPFRMTISPSQNELAWLLGKSRGSRLFYNGNSSLSLSGEGFTSGYNLAGEWNLTPAAYTFTDIVTKPVGTRSTLSFKGSINPQEATITALHYTLANMSLDLSAKYPYAAGKKLDLVVNTNQFNIGEIAAMLPAINKYQPSGRIQLAVRGETPGNGGDNLKWRGSLAMTNASFRPSETIKPLSAINGTVTIDEAALETSQLTAKIGSTSLSGKGAISSFDPLAFTASFSTPRIDLADFGFYHGKPLPQITKVRGEISLKEDNLELKSISGQINSSPLAIRGTITNLTTPKVDISLTSPFLNVADLLVLGELDRQRPAGEKSSAPLSLKAAIKADSGIFKETGFEKLNTTVQIDNRIIYLQPLDVTALGGKLSAKGRIDTLSTPARYQVNFKLANASATQVLQLVSVDKRELTGTLSVEGELTTKGGTPDELKKSALGSVKFSARNGSMRQFPVLSKVFSILNVSQLFKWRLPDMVSEGMPYNEIRGSVAIKDGVISTNDLFIASNAMNMSMVGKNDFVNDRLDLTLGIQPLQTVDKVVSNIPIVGWILTGKDKSLITAYFEIKGKSGNPQVSAVPVKYLGRGVFDIFKRVFQLPAKLVTDTGEVILGN